MNPDGSLHFQNKELLASVVAVTAAVVANAAAARGSDKGFTNQTDCFYNNGPDCAGTNNVCNNDQYCGDSVNNGPCSNLSCDIKTVNNGDCNYGTTKNC